MTDDNGAAVAAAEDVAAPQTEAQEPVQTPNPVESNGPEREEKPEQQQEPDKGKEGEKDQPKRSASVSEALKRADAKVKEELAKAGKVKEPEKVEAKPADDKAKQEGPTRDEAGKFASKESDKPAQEETKPAEDEKPATTRFHEAPRRFSEDAKKEWANAPEPIRAEIHRAVKEMETGINQYREAFEPLKPYFELAKQHNTSVPRAMENYVNLERTLLNDPERGLQMVADYAGINLREYAAKLLNQAPDEIQSQNDSTIRELRSEIQQLKQQLGGVTTSLQEQRTNDTLGKVEAFAAEHPRFEELAEDIAFFIKSGRTSDLQEAYELAERLNPAPVQAATQRPVDPAPAQQAHTQKGTKSVSGAPSTGSSPAAKGKPSSSIREALNRAAARAS